jgi:hypothetical protein
LISSFATGVARGKTPAVVAGTVSVTLGLISSSP